MLSRHVSAATAARIKTLLVGRLSVEEPVNLSNQRWTMNPNDAGSTFLRGHASMLG